ncbi:PIN domain-containing protein [Chelativorans sp. SCAU2101]|jgi:Predicted nucleic-acid-binding protein, contains PIN domain|uniref:PIN domain-containing protein n=1 Tax=Chelativorans petroleitrophicus TaxID=2975484 RepID=A0A9X3B5M4_9HYPH|nr:PIN domain-containing protein [Chelativorans petroleitrophicus]MCT8988942.1 PIN domain-containing protein [Chelativorans petroleitrophicus]
MPSAFLDTNILLYAAAGEANEPVKAQIARDLLAGMDFGLSLQVLQEFLVNAQKPSIGLPLEDIDAWLTDLLEFDCVFPDLDLFMQGIALSRRYGISYWDGSIIAAAERIEARILYTEDLTHDQLYGSVRAVNPFLE